MCCLGGVSVAAWRAPLGYSFDFLIFGFLVALWGLPFCCLSGPFAVLGLSWVLSEGAPLAYSLGFLVFGFLGALWGVPLRPLLIYSFAFFLNSNFRPIV